MTARTRHLATFAALTILLAVAIAPAAAEPAPRLVDPPVISWWGGLAESVRTAPLAGPVSATISNTTPYYSFSDGTIAAARDVGSGRSNLILFDATTGAQGVTVDDAFFPLIMPDGSKVIFLPDGNGSGAGDRDPSVNSVWSYDTASTVERRLIRFTNADRVPLNLALSPKGRLVAITHGNDADLFQWDIWTARIDEHRTRRLTHDGDSLYPAFSPGGKKIAFTKKDGTKACRGAIWIMNIDGSGAHRVVAGTCARSLMRPVWLNATTLAAWWWVTEGGVTTIKGLVTIDLPSGNVHSLAQGDILDYSVSRSLGILAYRKSDGSITIYDISSGTKTPGPDATLPKGPRVFLSGALELAY